ncbi:hypothetical protein MXB_3774, partial [Myxobolus squamalis]
TCGGKTLMYYHMFGMAIHIINSCDTLYTSDVENFVRMIQIPQLDHVVNKYISNVRELMDAIILSPSIENYAQILMELIYWYFFKSSSKILENCFERNILTDIIRIFNDCSDVQKRKNLAPSDIYGNIYNFSENIISIDSEPEEIFGIDFKLALIALEKSTNHLYVLKRLHDLISGAQCHLRLDC